MYQKKKRFLRGVSVILSLLMVISVISFPTLRAKADGVDDFIGRCYKVTLGRDADADGYAYWRDILVNRKQDGSVVAHGFLFSPEYINKKTSNEQYIKDLYMLFMGREPEKSGYDYWCEKMANGASREQIFAGFANSKEYYDLCYGYGITAGYYSADYGIQQVNGVNLFVERMYQTSLGRLGDQGGQNDWVQALLEGRITGVECARCFVQSPEFINKGLSDEDYLKSLYIAFMGREYDQGGLDYWLENIENGNTRDEVFAGFANSKEFAGICEEYNIEKGSYVAKDVHKPLRFRLKKETNSYGNYLVYEYKGDSDEEYTAKRYLQNGTYLGIEKYFEKTANGEITIQSSFDSVTGAPGYSQRRVVEWNSDKTKCVTKYYDESTGEFGGWVDEFYENGRIVKARAYDKDGNLGRISDYKYPEENRVIWEEFSYSMDTGFISDERSYYDNNGVITKVETKYSGYNNPNANSYTVVEEYKDGNLVKQYSYDEGDEQNIHLMGSYEYKDGKLYKEYSYWANNELSGWYLYEYNSAGLLTKRAMYSAEFNRESYGEIYVYDEYNNMIRQDNFTHIINSMYSEDVEIVTLCTWEYEQY